MAKQLFSIKGFDNKHFQNSQRFARIIDDLYKEAVKDIGKTTTGKISMNKDFRFRKALDDRIGHLSNDVHYAINQATKEEWLLSCKKNDEFVKSILDISKLERGDVEKYMDRNLDALKTFQGRKVDGMNLSQRVWKYNEAFKKQIELSLDHGIGEGASAQRMSRDLKENLREPDKLFRRVRQADGSLRLSRAAKLYHPGRGVYRSAHKNAMRLARTEINMAYRESDWRRWQSLDFVAGFEVIRSNREPMFECPVCSKLAGRYPKEFKFVGWHPQCLCFAIPVLQPYEELRKNRKQRFKDALWGKQPKQPSKPSNYVTKLPKGFIDWVNENIEKAKNWNSIPYFVRDNFVGGQLSGGLTMFGGKIEFTPGPISAPKVLPKPKEVEQKTLIGEGTQAKVYDRGDGTVEKQFNKDINRVEELIDDYTELIGEESNLLVKVYSTKDGKIIMEKLDTNSRKLDIFKSAERLFKAGLDELSILEYSINDPYIQERIGRIKGLGNQIMAEKYIEFIKKVNKEGMRLGINIDDFHRGNFGVDKDGNIKMFDFRKTPSGFKPAEQIKVERQIRAFTSQIRKAKTVNQVEKTLLDVLKKETIQFGGTKVDFSGSKSLAHTKRVASELGSLTLKYRLDSPLRSVSIEDIEGSVLGYVQASPQFIGTDLKVTKKVVLGNRLHTNNQIYENKADWGSRCPKDKLNIYTTSHEFGHLLYQTSTEPGVAREFGRKIKALNEQYIKEYSKGSKQKSEAIFLGRYGFTNLDEFFAEGFQEYRNSRNPSKYAKEIGKLVEEYYSKY